jgi:hypothetical protein
MSNEESLRAGAAVAIADLRPQEIADLARKQIDGGYTSESDALMARPLVWTQADAVALCRAIEDVCPPSGCHVALTGGALYKDGPRKDADLLFYRIRQRPEIDMEALFAALGTVGVAVTFDYGWCVKATYEGKPLDLFFPERDGDDYPSSSAAKEEVGLLCLTSGSEVAF